MSRLNFPVQTRMKRDAVMVPRIEVRLDLEDDSGELAPVGRDRSGGRHPGAPAAGESGEEGPARNVSTPKLLRARTKKTRRHLAGEEGLLAELASPASSRQVDLVADLCRAGSASSRRRRRPRSGQDVGRHLVRAAGHDGLNSSGRSCVCWRSTTPRELAAGA